ncbi:MAG: hypothetical protein AAGI88_09175 [Pseudomonadota bacterium]
MPSYSDIPGGVIRGGRFGPPEVPTPDPGGFKTQLNYLGGFRIRKGNYGISRSTNSPGGLHVASDGNLWLVGHSNDRAIGKFQIPADSALSPSHSIADMPLSDNVLPFFTVIPAAGIPTVNPRIVGTYDDGTRLRYHIQDFYGDGSNTYNHGYYTIASEAVTDFRDINAQDGALELNPEKAAGWMYPVPSALVSTLGSTWYMGHSNTLSRTIRHSFGPSLFTWNGNSDLDPIDPQALMYFEVDDLGPYGATASPPQLWNQVSKAYTGFFFGGDYVCVGMNGAYNSAIDYKISNPQGWGIADPDDQYPYFWRFGNSDITGAATPRSPRPFEHGELPTGVAPMTNSDGSSFSSRADSVVGATFDYGTNRLYVQMRTDKIQTTAEQSSVIYVFEVTA